MQKFDWNDLRYLLALERTGSLSGAGHALNTSETTVSRRLKALERALDTRLVMRHGTAPYQLTDAARQMVERIDVMEREALAIADQARQAKAEVYGVVRITTVPLLMTHIVVPALRSLRESYPEITLELGADERNLSLSKREADIAIRFARPRDGGRSLLIQKLGDLRFAVFRSTKEEAVTEWISYDDAHAHLPQAQWIAVQNSDAKIKVSDAQTAMEVAARGLGQTLLPVQLGLSDPRLKPVDEEFGRALPVRDVWLVSHKDQQDRPAIKAVKAWLSGLRWNGGLRPLAPHARAQATAPRSRA